MRRLTPVVLLATAALVTLPTTAGAVTIHQHLTDPVTHEPIVRVVTVAPPDTDDDGCANAQDHYRGPGCKPPPPPPPPPAPVASPQVATPTAAPTYTAPASSGGCPSYMAGEASSPSAVNSSSGASGCYQVLPSTAAAMGSACADVNASSCVAAICASAGNAAWASSGATPCDYLRP